MSRRTKTSPTPSGPPPSHPQEQLRDHRAFLIRSLNRNDKELAALMELNESLHRVKKQVIDECGETTLLDLGEGKIRIKQVSSLQGTTTGVVAGGGIGSANDDGTGAANHDKKDNNGGNNKSSKSEYICCGRGAGGEELEMDDDVKIRLQKRSPLLPSLLRDKDQQELCIDFLLRSKLRRKILNRLARRLNRIAHSMDGEDISAPGPPKYGDLRLHLDSQLLKEFSNRTEKQQHAKEAIRLHLERKNLKQLKEQEQLMLPPQDGDQTEKKKEEHQDEQEQGEQQKDKEAKSGDDEDDADKSSEREEQDKEEEGKSEEENEVEVDRSEEDKMELEDGERDEEMNAEVDKDDQDPEEGEKDEEMNVGSSDKEGKEDEDMMKVESDNDILSESNQGMKRNEDEEVKLESTDIETTSAASEEGEKEQVNLKEESENDEANKSREEQIKKEETPEDSEEGDRGEKYEQKKGDSAEKEMMPKDNSEWEEEEQKRVKAESIENQKTLEGETEQVQANSTKRETLSEVIKQEENEKEEERKVVKPEDTQGEEGRRYLCVKTEFTEDTEIPERNKEEQFEPGEEGIKVEMEIDKMPENLNKKEAEEVVSAENQKTPKEVPSSETRAKDPASDLEDQTKLEDEKADSEEAMETEVKLEEERADSEDKRETSGIAEADTTKSLGQAGEPEKDGDDEDKSIEAKHEKSSSSDVTGKDVPADPVQSSPSSSIFKEDSKVAANAAKSIANTNNSNSNSNDNNKEDIHGDNRNEKDIIHNDDNTTTTDKKEDSSSCPPLYNEFEIIKEYYDSYEKLLNPSSGETKYPILEQPHEEDHVSIKYGAGIGATHRSMTVREKEAEYKRWQTSLLQSIPEVTTFEDLGVKNRVFLSEERRKRAMTKDQERENEEIQKKKLKLGDDEEEGDSDEDDDVKMKEEVEDDDDMEEDDDDEDGEEEEDDDDEEEEEDQDEEKKLKDEEDGVQKTEEEDEDMEDKDDDDNEEDDDNDEDKGDEDQSNAESEVDNNKIVEDNKDDSSSGPAKEAIDSTSDEKKESDDSLTEKKRRIKTISLVPIPSFREQDIRRIRLIHSDLMASSMHEHARRRLAEVTADYNTAFRASNALCDRRQRLQNQLNTFVYEHRAKINKLKNDYNVKIAIARNRWKQKKAEYDENRLKNLMPSKWGRAPTGTMLTSRYISGATAALNNPGSGGAAAATQCAIVAGICVADLVDATVLKLQGSVKDPRNTEFEQFVPPPVPDFTSYVADKKTGETFAQQQLRVETAMRKEITSLSVQLNNSEEERKRTWKKMLKTKAEFDYPAAMMNSLAGPGGVPGAAGSGPPSQTAIEINNMQLAPMPPLRASTTAAAPAPPALPPSAAQPAALAAFAAATNTKAPKKPSTNTAAFTAAVAAAANAMAGSHTTANASRNARHPAAVHTHHLHSSAAAALAAAAAGSHQTPHQQRRPAAGVSTPGAVVAGSDSKYSAARVRERISADGTVAPVTMPKKTKDGLYQRPAGRTRKGMEWDAVHGVWVPVGSKARLR